MYFKNELKKRLKNEKGLTLIELLAVIVILAIIAAIAIPAIGNIIQNTRTKAVIADAQNILSAANLYITDQGTAAGVDILLEDLESTGQIDNPGTIETATVTTATGGNTIEFTAKAGNTDVAGEGLTLEDLNNLEVKKGQYQFIADYTPSTGAKITPAVTTTP